MIGPVMMEKRMGLNGQPCGIPSVDSTLMGCCEDDSQKKRESKEKECWKKRKSEG